MPKVKTNSSAKKRFRVRSSGKIKRFQAGTRHLRRKKSSRAKTNLVGSANVSTADSKRIKALLGIN